MSETVSQHNEKQLERAKRLVRSMLERTEERGFTEAEAMEAAAKVGEMLRQWDLELTDVLVQDTTNMVWGEVYAPDNAMGSVTVGIAKLCSLRTYHQNHATVTTYKLFGHKPDVELATFLFEVCSEAADHGWQAHMDRHGYSKKARDSYRMGFGGRIYTRMVELRQQRDDEARARADPAKGTALLVVKDQIVTQEFEKQGIKLTKRKGAKVHNPAAYYAGQNHANSVNLNNPLTSDRENQSALQ